MVDLSPDSVALFDATTGRTSSKTNSFFFQWSSLNDNNNTLFAITLDELTMFISLLQRNMKNLTGDFSLVFRRESKLSLKRNEVKREESMSLLDSNCSRLNGWKE